MTASIKSILRTFRGSDKCRTKSRNAGFAPHMESLEGRKLMAADMLSNGALLVTGSDQAEVIQVSETTEFSGWHLNTTLQRSVGGRNLTPLYQPLFQQVVKATIHSANADGSAGQLLYSETFPRDEISSIQINARGGNDVASNHTTMNSIIWGGAGDDVLHGNVAVDQLVGGSGNDVAYGKAGNDRLWGQSGEDSLFGDSGDDRLYGGTQNDSLSGGSHNDIIYGESGDDVLRGNSGNDSLRGGSGDDGLFGGSGSDSLRGGSGDDRLFGGSGGDSLRGDSGNDGLFGGAGVDSLSGNSGGDRYLIDRASNGTAEDTIQYLSSSDARINFLDGGATSTVLGSNFGLVNVSAATWSDAEIELIDDAFQALMEKTGNTSLLKKSNGSEMDFVRQGEATSQDGTEANVNGWNGFGTVTLVDNAFTNNDVTRTVTHEIGHNWDDYGENSFIEEFRDESGWQFFYPWQDTTGHTATNDFLWSGWHFDNDGVFARNYGKMNPLEDFATTFAAYMSAEMDRNYFSESPTQVTDRMTDKFDVLDDFFASLS